MKRFHLVLMLVLVASAYAATPNPGHDASRIGAGAFSNGNYSFPANLNITGTLQVDTSTLYVNSSTNRIGIGTVLPAAELHVNTSSTTEIRLDYGAANYGRLHFGGDGVIIVNGATATDPYQMHLSTTGGIRFSPGNIDALYLNASTRYVGIGTTNPTHTLHVVGSANITSVTHTPQLCLAGDCKTTWPTTSGISTAAGWTNTSSLISLSNTSNNVSANTLYIDNANGRIGIGTSIPSWNLHINSSGYTVLLTEGASGAIMRLTDSGAAANQKTAQLITDGGATRLDIINDSGSTTLSPITITHNNGYVGIATTPSYPLSVGNSVSAGSISSGGNWNVSINGANGISLGTQSTTGDAVFGTTASDKGIAFVGWNGSTNTERMRITSAGNVGVGTATPLTLLHLNGTTPELRIDFASNTDSAILRFAAGGATKWRMTADGADLSPAGFPKLKFWAQGGYETLTLSDENVGIGTMTPTQSLDVNGSINISSASGILYVPQICLNGVCSSSWSGGVSSAGGWTNTTTVVSLSTSTNNVSANTLFVDNTNGRVGVGTTNPSYPIHVNSATNAIVQLNRGTSGYTAGIIGQLGSDEWELHLGTGFSANANGLAVIYNGNRYFDISTTGRVGVNNTDPVGVFDVDGRADGWYVSEANHNTINRGGGDVDNLDLWINYVGYNGSTSRFRDFRVGDGKQNTIAFFDGSSRSVGIGTATPTQTLEVAGNIIANSTSRAQVLLLNQEATRLWTWVAQSSSRGGRLDLRTSTGQVDPDLNTFILTINATGSVGIGTSEPQAKLQVDGAHVTGRGIIYANGSDHGYIMVNAPFTGEAGFAIRNDTGAGWGIYRPASSSDLRIYDGMSTTDRVTIKQGTGNVGIGTDTPDAKLDVSGLVLATNYSTMTGLNGTMMGYDGTNGFVYARKGGTYTPFYLDASAVYLNAQSGGNVGVKTSAPNSTLHVSGTANVTSTLFVGGALTAATIDTGSGAMDLGDAAVANGDTNSIPTGDQVYDFVTGQGYITVDDDTPDNDGEVPDAHTISGGTIGSNTVSASAAWTMTDTLNIDSGTIFVNGSGNFVGVGTTYPTRLMDVNGLIRGRGTIAVDRSSGDLTAYGYLMQRDAGSVGNYGNPVGDGATEIGAFNTAGIVLGTLGAQPVVIATNNAERMRVASDGKVGIGTNTSTDLLHVKGAGRSSAGNNVIANFESTGSNASINIAHSGNGGQIGYSNLGSTGNLFYITTGTGAIGSGITMDNSGNVGINVTTPINVLDLRAWPAATRAHIAFGNPTATSGSASAKFTFMGNGIEHAGIFWTPVSSGVGKMQFSTGGSLDPSANSIHMTIQNNGRVGIGNTNPSQELDVQGDILASGYLGTATGVVYMDNYSGSNFFQRISGKTHVYDDGLLSMTWDNGNASINNNSRFFIDGGSDTFISNLNVDDAMYFHTGGTSKFFITSSAGVYATNPFYLDGGGNTYIYEQSADAVEIIAGATRSLRITPTYVEVGAAGAALDFIVNNGRRIYVDGGSDTYIYRDASNNIALVNDGVTQLQVRSDGVFFSGTGTTANAANAYLDGADSNRIYRSTSSLRYKNVTDNMSVAEAQRIVLNAIPIEYKPIEGGGDYIGLAAEWMHELDPRTVTYDAQGRPDWVQYPHLVAPLMLVAQDHEARIAALETPGRSENAPGRVKEEGNDVVITLGGEQQ